MLQLDIQLLQQIIILILLWFLLTKVGRRQFHQIRKSVRHLWQRQQDGKFRHWHPKTPEDCPHCCAGIQLQVARINHQVTPWADRKGKGGAKKQSDTSGFACLNPLCDYFGITNAAIHALVQDCYRGKDGDIRQLKCQCCQKRFSSRKGTPLYQPEKEK